MRKLLFLIPLLIAFGLFGFFYAGLKDERDPSALPSALLDKPAPQFDLPALLADRPGLATSDLKGSVQLVNVFASWCVPCRQEHPLFMSLSRSNEVPIYGINYKDEAANALGFLEELGNPYRAASADTGGRTARDWGVYGVPETFVVDRDGTIVYKVVGAITREEMNDTLIPKLEQLQSEAS